MPWQMYARLDDASDDAPALFVIDERDGGASLLRFTRDGDEAGGSPHPSREEAMRAAEGEHGRPLEWRRIPRWLGDDSDDLLSVLLPTIDEEDMDEDAWE